MKEFWKDIKGYEGLYQISNKGNILNTKFQKLLKKSIRKAGKGENIYVVVCLRKDGESNVFQVNRLVYQHFIGEIKGMIDHLDENRLNCSVENLIDVHKTFKFKKENCNRILDINTMKIYESISDLAKEIGISDNNLSCRIRTKSKKYSQYIHI